MKKGLLDPENGGIMNLQMKCGDQHHIPQACLHSNCSALIAVLPAITQLWCQIVRDVMYKMSLY